MSSTTAAPAPAASARELADQASAFLARMDASVPSTDAAREALHALRISATAVLARWEGAASDATAEVRLRFAVDRFAARLPEPSAITDRLQEWQHLRDELQPALEALWEALPQPDVPEDRTAAHPRPQNYLRSGVHAAAGVGIVLAFEHLLSPTVAIAVAIAWTAWAWSLETTRRAMPAWNQRLMAFFGPVAHAYESEKVNSATWFGTALLVLSLTAGNAMGMLGVLALAIGDPAAGVIGRKFGRTRIVHGRSLEGSLAFAVASMLTGSAYLALYAPELSLTARMILAATAAVVGAITEALSHRLDDNLTIPIVVGWSCTAMGWLIGA